MKKHWFVSSARVIRGPLSRTEVEQSLAIGLFTDESRVWWRGQSQWISIALWQSQLPLLEKTIEMDQTLEVWSFEHGGVIHGPITLEKLVQVIEKNPDLQQFKIQKLGSEEWVGVYSCPDLLEAMGLSRRKHSRVPISGSTMVQMPYDTVVAETVTISSGGLGLAKAHLPVGNIVKFTLKSPVIAGRVTANAEVVYTKSDGFSGLKFEKLHAEAQTLVSDYVRKFENVA
jgi:hypothetical protein